MLFQQWLMAANPVKQHLFTVIVRNQSNVFAFR
jgi:hypothetical protein